MYHHHGQPPLPLDFAYREPEMHPGTLPGGSATPVSTGENAHTPAQSSAGYPSIDRGISPDVGPTPPRSGRSDEDLEECIAAWQLSCHAHQAYDRSSLQRPKHSPVRSVVSTGADGIPQLGPVLLVNVGGEVFRTTAATVRRAPFFDSMLRHAEEGVMGTTVDSEGRLFVDRSGELFAYILGYLQSGHWLLRERSCDPQFVDALRDEAGFYGLDAAEDRLPVPRISEYATVWQFQEDASLYVDCLEQTVREDPDHQGLFRLCKYSGGLPLDQQTCTKRFKATSHSVQSVVAYFASRGFSLEHVVEGCMITHTTSAEGQTRSGHGVQYILSRLTTSVETNQYNHHYMTPAPPVMSDSEGPVPPPIRVSVPA